MHEDLTDDRLLGQRVILRQSRNGYRAAIDPVLLAAAVDARQGSVVLDAGLGAGAVSLCLLARRPDLRIIGIESDPATCALAEANAAVNGVADRLAVRCGPLASVAAVMADAGEHVDAVVTNPPYLTTEQADPSPSPARARANVESFDLGGWIAACIHLLKRKGSITLIHRADRLDDAIVALRRADCGEIAVLPLWPHRDEAARRVVIRARKNVAGPARLLPGLVLHNPDGGFTAAADAILRDGAALPLKSSTSAPDSAS